MRIRSVTCAKNHDEPCDKTRKPNSRALCGLQQCPSSRRVLKPNRGTISSGKDLPTSEQDPLKPIPPPTPMPTLLTTPTVPDSVSTSTPASHSTSPATASGEGDLDRKPWPNSSTQTELDSHDLISTGSTSQPILPSWSLSVQPNVENASSSGTGPTAEGDFVATTSSSYLSSDNAVTWQVTPFYSTLTKDPEMEIHSGSGEDSEQPENKEESNSVIWSKIGGPRNDDPMEKSTEMPLGPPPTPLLGEASLQPPFSTVIEGPLPSQSPSTLKTGTLRAEGMVTEKSTNTPLLHEGDHQPILSEKSVKNHHLEPPDNRNVTRDSEPVLTEEDASSLIAEGFLLNASNYKQLMKDHTPAYWIVGNWSEVRG